MLGGKVRHGIEAGAVRVDDEDVADLADGAQGGEGVDGTSAEDDDAGGRGEGRGWDDAHIQGKGAAGGVRARARTHRSGARHR